jgi:UDP-N-acetylmuramate dehydrogenase
VRLTPNLVEDIRRIIPARVLIDAPLSRFTSLRIGGPADMVVEPGDPGVLVELLGYLGDRGVPRIILGAGTNVLFPDSGFRGVVIRTKTLRTLAVTANGSDHAKIIASAGVPLLAVIGRASRLGLKGMEPLWGIPGSLGGALAVNAGAGGVCTADYLEELKLLTIRGEERLVKKADLDYSYRRMKLPRDSVIVEGTFRLSRGEPAKIKADLDAAIDRRRMGQPWKEPSAGCVFKNPSPEKPAGAIIDRLGFKGARAGGAQVSQIHANFIINRGNATASDVLDLVEKIRGRVKEAENIELELEICVIKQESGND